MFSSKMLSVIAMAACLILGSVPYSVSAKNFTIQNPEMYPENADFDPEKGIIYLR
jgi:hypothetical protein